MLDYSIEAVRLRHTQRSPFRLPSVQGEVVSGQAGAGATNSASIRQPSATMAIVLVAQIQFLATLSLVDNTGAEDSTVSAFADNLR